MSEYKPLDWLEHLNCDGKTNSQFDAYNVRYRGELVSGCVFIIHPCLRRNRCVWRVSHRSVRPRYSVTIERAQAACERLNRQWHERAVLTGETMTKLIGE